MFGNSIVECFVALYREFGIEMVLSSDAVRSGCKNTVVVRICDDVRRLTALDPEAPQ